ncbi:MAG: protein-export chaperone SecB [Candidatus Izemoplasmatales bacterium]|nr:hypothetical protein [Acholeplasmataceae bacterium]
MKFKKMTLMTDRIEYRNNNLAHGEFKLKPMLSREIKKLNMNVYFTRLNLKIENSRENPFPINLSISLRGVFEFDDIFDESEVTSFLRKEAVEILYPYLRTLVTNVTTMALMPPIVLPIVDIAKLFPDTTESQASFNINIQ